MSTQKLNQNGNGGIPGGCVEPLYFGDVDVPVVPVSQNDINREYDVSVSNNYKTPKDKPKRFVPKTIIFDTNDPKQKGVLDDIVQPLCDSSSTTFKSAVIDALVESDMLLHNPDLDWFEKKYPHVVSQYLLVGEVEMAQQIKELQGQVSQLHEHVLRISKQQDENSRDIAWMRKPVTWLRSMLIRTETQQQIIKPNTKEKLTDGKVE